MSNRPTATAINGDGMSKAITTFASIRGRGLLLQRKCACGAPTSSLTGECSECQSKKRLQTKLTIGASNDPLEQEADRVADQVMAAPAHANVTDAPPRIQRFTEQTTGDAGSAPASVDQALASSGSPLEPALRQDMEQRFGHDFSRVRVHADAAAEQSAREVNAHAYTVGHDVVFAAGQYAPQSAAGHRLLAHELTHVVQQSREEGVDTSQHNPKSGRFHLSLDRGIGFGAGRSASANDAQTYTAGPRIVRPRTLQRKPKQPGAGIQEFRLDSDEEKQRTDAIQIVTDYRDLINDEAKKHGIPPEAIAGAILWEALENPYSRSFARRGPGKIRSDVAEKAEQAGFIEKPDTDNENEAGNIRGERLGKGGWALRYAGAIMRLHAKNYMEIAHVDISKDAGVLCTLFNTGDSEEKAKAFAEKLASDPNAKPQPNDTMGQWVNDHASDIKELLNPKPAFDNPQPAYVLPIKMNAEGLRERAVFVKKEKGGPAVHYPQEIRRGGDPAWLTNNPGLLEYNTAIKLRGCYDNLKLAVKSHRVAIYPSRARGLVALKEFLRAHQGERTLRLIVETIPLLKATTKQASEAISSGMGLPESTLVRSLSDAQLAQLAEEIEKVQGTTAGKAEPRTK